MLKHQVWIETGKEKGDGYWLDPKIYDPADEDRVKLAAKLFRKHQGGKAFVENQGKTSLVSPLVALTIGVIGGLITSGMLANLIGAGPSSQLWIKAHPLFRPLLAQYPGLFAALSLEMGGFLALHEIAGNLERKMDAKKQSARWLKHNFQNHELVHIFKHGEADARYQADDLYWMNQNWLPDSAKDYVERKGKREQLEWGRFVRDGDFNLYLGEFYEQFGRFSTTPRILRVPYSGLWTGIAVFGPTGKGKSEAIARPFIDQLLGYYHWVDSERDTWLFDVTTSISQMKDKAERLSGGERRELLDKTARIEREAEIRLKKTMEGQDPNQGYEKAGLIVIEPKDDIWATQLELCKKFGRDRDYIEIGVVNEKFMKYQAYSAQLQDIARQLWSFVPNKAIGDSVLKWVLGFSYRNGILNQEQAVDFWISIEGRDIRVPLQPRSQKSQSAVVPILNGVYGDSSADSRWVEVGFGTANTVRRDGLRYAASLRQDDQSEIVEDYFGVMLDQALANPGPFSSPPKASLPRELGVLPFGLGVANDPWVRSSLGLADRGARVQLNQAQGQRLVVDPFQRMVLFASLLGGGTRFADVKRGDTSGRVRPTGSVGSVFGWSDWTLGLQESLRESQEKILELAPDGKPYDDLGIAELVLPVPMVNPTGLLTPTVSKVRIGPDWLKDGAPTPALEEQTVIQAIKEALNLMPADKEETKLLRKRVRSAAPPVVRPGERRYDFRKRYALWWAERRRRQFDFVDGVLKVLTTPSSALRAVEDGLRAQGGDPVVQGLLRLLVDACPTGMLEAVARFALHSDATRDQVVEHLRGLGYLFFQGLDETEARENSRVERAQAYKAYDQVIHRGLRPSADLIARLCVENGIAYDAEGGRFRDKDAHLAFRRAEEAFRLAGSLSALLSRAALPEEVEVLVVVLKSWLAPDRLASEGIQAGGTWGSAEWCLAAMKALRRADQVRNLVYAYEPGMPTLEPITDDPEDLEAVVDCSTVGIALGPWDALWSEGVGERLWPKFQVISRSVMTKAIGLYAEEESRLAREVMPDGTAPGNQRGVVELGLKARRDEVFAGCMTYLQVVENYLRVLSPYYKVNTAFPFGYKDFGGIGDCQGATKFNPLHHPDMTPEQVAAMLVGILARNAGTGDTPFWNDSAKVISEGFLSLLRSGPGYATVQALHQMVVSDAFADLVVAQGEARLKRMRESAGGSHSGEVLRQQMVFSQWAKLYGLQDEPDRMAEALDNGELPAEIDALLPRAASGTEIKTLEGNLQAGRSFLISEWRSDRGSFSDKEIRSTCKLNLLNQLTPLTNGIGAFSFSPEDEEELSFPTPTEMRNRGLCVATRFNYANNKKLGSVVLGMFIAAYEMMVLSAKQQQTQAKETFVRIQGLLTDRRAKLKELRAETRALRLEMALPKASPSSVQTFLHEQYQALPQNLDPATAADRLVAALFEAERQGALKDRGGRSKARVAYDTLPGAQFMSSQGGIAARFMGTVGGSVTRVQDEVRRLLEREVNLRQEKEYEIADRVNRNEALIWQYRQEVLNALSEVEEFPNWSRIMMLLIDEYQFFANTNVKGSGLTDVDFLATSRAGKSINVFITQTPSSVKSSGMGMDMWEQWISNTLVRICLGAPNKQDQEYISDLFRGEKVKKEKESSFNLSFEGVDVSQTSGDLRASEVGSGSKSFTITEEYEKYVSPDDLANMLAFTSYVQWTDGQRTFKPHMVYHTPYFLATSESVSAVTKDPIAQKTWLALVRDGELNLNKPNPDDARAMLEDLARTGAEVDFAEVEAIEKLRKESQAL